MGFLKRLKNWYDRYEKKQMYLASIREMQIHVMGVAEANGLTDEAYNKMKSQMALLESEYKKVSKEKIKF